MDGRNTKKTKKPKTTTADFFVNSYFSQIFSKKVKITISFFEENSKITILFWVLAFSFMYLVSVYLTNQHKLRKILLTKLVR